MLGKFWLTARGMDQLTRKADRLFRESCTDPILTGYSAGLPLGGLPEIQRGLSVRGAHHGYEKLADVVRAVISRDWRQLSPKQIEHATDLYLCCLSWAEECSNITPLAPVALAKENSYA